MSTQDKRGSLFYTLLGYFVILLVLALITFGLGLGMYWSGFLRLMGSVSEDTFVKWSGFAIFTPLTFGFVIQKSRTRWRNKVFWRTIVTVLFVHIVGFLAAFRKVEHWTALHFFVICTVEGPVIMTVVNSVSPP